ARWQVGTRCKDSSGSHPPTEYVIAHWGVCGEARSRSDETHEFIRAEERGRDAELGDEGAALRGVVDRVAAVAHQLQRDDGTTASRPENGLIVERSEEHTSELQSHLNLVCRLLLEKKK